MRYDLAVIGSGGGAYAAAIAARRKGKRVLMVERGTVGGTCVNTGCVPSKALLAAAEARHVALHQPFPGIRTSADAADFAALIGAERALVDEMRADKYVDLGREYGWEILRGHAAFIDGPVLDVRLDDGDTRPVEAEHYVIGTSSAPWAPPIDGLAGAGDLTSTTAMELDSLPESLIVIGGNYIGLEQGQLFARLGTRVTILEALERLAPTEEPEVSESIRGVFADEGMETHTPAEVVDASGYVITARTDSGARREFRAEQLLFATGRRPVTDGLNLDAVGVKVGARGEVVVDEHLRTHNPRIWGVGDVTGNPQFPCPGRRPGHRLRVPRAAAGFRAPRDRQP